MGCAGIVALIDKQTARHATVADCIDGVRGRRYVRWITFAALIEQRSFLINVCDDRGGSAAIVGASEGIAQPKAAPIHSEA
jgi:hypothetical protein